MSTYGAFNKVSASKYFGCLCHLLLIQLIPRTARKMMNVVRSVRNSNSSSLASPRHQPQHHYSTQPPPPPLQQVQCVYIPSLHNWTKTQTNRQLCRAPNSLVSNRWSNTTSTPVGYRVTHSVTTRLGFHISMQGIHT